MNKLLISVKALRQLGWRAGFSYIWYQFLLHSGLFYLLTPTYSLDFQVPENRWGLRPLNLDVDALSILSNGEREKIRAEADQLVDGQVRLFGAGPQVLVLTLMERPGHWSQHRAEWIDGQDIKFIWEPGRFCWTSLLARAYHLQRDEKYAAAFWQYVEGFLHGNPPNSGPHWASAQEVALRLISLVYSFSLLEVSAQTTEERRNKLAAALAAHADRIPPTLVYARAQNNNHLLSEAAALYTAAIILPEHPHATRWKKLGWKWFNIGLHNQIDEEGCYIQHSTNYHRLMLQLALWVKRIANEVGESLPPLSLKRLASATRWLLTLLDEDSGGVPNLGANDGAYILPLTVLPFADHRPVVQAAGLAFLGKSPLQPGAWDEMVNWLVLRPSESSLTFSQPALCRIDGDHSWANLRAAQFSNRPGHSDQLHLDLWWRGLNVFGDPGSYLYNAPPPWDNILMTNLVHNTITINGSDPMTRAGKFLWLDWAQAEVVHSSARTVTAQHLGYSGLIHRRTVSVKIPDEWVVKDEVIPEKSGFTDWFDLRLHWLLPDWQWELDGSNLLLQSPHGMVTLSVDSDLEMVPCLVRAGELLAGDGPALPVWGWHSPTYGVKQPALSFAIYAQAQSQINLTTNLRFPKNQPKRR